MPCPYFEPRQLVAQPLYLQARLPLVEEYEGVCLASGSPQTPPAESHWQYCNHGNARGHCPCFPANETLSARRFDVLRRSAAALDVLVVEESSHAPVAWTRLTYVIDSAQIDPPPDGACLTAQLRAFCASYLRRFPG